MAPEKERLMREARLQVASFEVNPQDGSMDQKKAIKAYSRSAADAEIPLPHDLRPESSLKTTMTYLLHNIMNLCDDDNTSIGDWFHFVWDRTRGIRKDITQQELCSPVTVELVEQCVRFHIHCAARLVAEDPSTFDQKINTENLTKCLQTLKYMYNDLKAKNVMCPNEAEFRAYVVLLNLNESGNFLWEIKQLEKNILNSTHVRFALDVYFAVANNNYVKFFNLVREASYMSACLALRYFTQVRMRAIRTIMRAYTPRKVGFNYNISYLSEILAFEDFEATVNFLNVHGLMCDVDADIVLLDRDAFGPTETPYQLERALQMVESKMESTVAEAVCGGSLPSPDCFLNLVPHSSFDNNGFLKREAFYAEDQNGPSPAVTASQDNVFKIPRGSPPVSPSQQRLFRNDQADGSMAENVFYKQPTASPFARSSPPASKSIFKSAAIADAKPSNPFSGKTVFGSGQNQASQSIFGPSSTTNLMPRPAAPAFGLTPAPTFGQNLVSQSPKTVFGAPGSFTSPVNKFGQNVEQQTSFGFSFAAQAKEEELKRKREEETERKRVENELLAKEKADDEERQRIRLEMSAKLERERREAEEAKQQAEDERRQAIAEAEQKMQRDCETILESLVGEVVGEKVKKEAEQSIALYVKLPEEFYEALEFDVTVENVYKIYRQEFLAYVNETKQKYEAMQNCFSHWRNTTRQEIRRREKLSTIGCSILNSSLEQQAESLYRTEQSAALSNMKQYLSGSPQAIALPDLNKYPPINLFSDIKMKEIDTNSKIFWKFLVSIPFKNEEKCLGFSTFINKWLIKTFDPVGEEIFFIDEKLMSTSRRKLGVCIRKVQGSEMICEKGSKSPEVVRHSNGLVFFTTSSNLPASRKRLQNILDKLDLPVPVSLIVYKNQVAATDEQELSRYFDLSTEVKVSTFEINLFYECHEKDKNLTQVVIDSCQFLNDSFVSQISDKNFRLYGLESQHILDFFQVSIGEEMWQRVEISCRQNEKLRKSVKSFGNVIQLYNKCLDKLMEMITNDFSKLPSLPSEFRERLPPVEVKIPNGYECFPDGWTSSRTQRLQINFIHALKLVAFQNDHFRSFDDFKVKLMTFLASNLTSNREKVFQSVVGKVIGHLYRLNLVKDDEVAEGLSNFCWLGVLGDVVVGKFNETFQKNSQVPATIIYPKKELHQYKAVPWWYTIAFNSSSDLSHEPQSKKQRLDATGNEDFETILKRSVSSLNKLSHKIDNFKEVSEKTREVSTDFDKHLFTFEEKFRAKLQAWEEKFKD